MRTDNKRTHESDCGVFKNRIESISKINIGNLIKAFYDKSYLKSINEAISLCLVLKTHLEPTTFTLVCCSTSDYV